MKHLGDRSSFGDRRSVRKPPITGLVGKRGGWMPEGSVPWGRASPPDRDIVRGMKRVVGGDGFVRVHPVGRH